VSKDKFGYPNERAFSGTIIFDEVSKKSSLEYVVQEVGPALNSINLSQNNLGKLLPLLNEQKEDQYALSSHVDGLSNSFLQNRMDKLTSKIESLTKIILVLTFFTVILALITVYLTAKAAGKLT
jgi:hypothetical protein